MIPDTRDIIIAGLERKLKRGKLLVKIATKIYNEIFSEFEERDTEVLGVNLDGFIDTAIERLSRTEKKNLELLAYPSDLLNDELFELLIREFKKDGFEYTEDDNQNNIVTIDLATIMVLMKKDPEELESAITAMEEELEKLEGELKAIKASGGNQKKKKK